MKIKFLTMLALFSTSAVAESLTILSTGSKTGSYTMQSVAYAKDFESFYDVKLTLPGGHCKAMPMVDNIQGPLLMPWASDFEAIGRDGIGCATYDISQATVVRYNRDAMRVCSMDDKGKQAFLQDGASAKVGHTVPTPVFARAVDAINSSFGTAHKSISYDGNGAGRTALINGEIDYYITSPKHGRYIEENGGNCFYELSTKTEHSELDSLQDLDPDNRFLTLGYDTVWLAVNMSDEQVASVKNKLVEFHNNCSSAIGEYGNCGESLKVEFDLDRDEIVRRWEQSVSTMREKE